MIRLACSCLLILGSLTAVAAAAPAPAPPVKVIDLPPDSINGDWSRVAEYRVVPGDELLLNFGPDESAPSGFLERNVIVRPDGRISVFPVGDVVAAGRTPRELEAAIVDLLAASFRQPRVVVEVAKLAGNQVHVLGRVAKPGSYPADPFITVAQAITMAGGFSDDAARNSVLVFHRLGAREMAVAELPLDRMIKRGSLAADLPLQRFDIIYVPRSSIGNIGVFVSQLFTPAEQIVRTGLIGWELFHLSSVYHIAP